MQDLNFRILIAATLLAAMSISFYFRRQADLHDRKISMGEEGGLAIGYVRVLVLAFMAGMLSYFLHPSWLDWARMPLPESVRWLGVGGMVACIPLFFWLFRNLGKNVTPTVEVRNRASLVTSGPYRWVRHPLYTVGTLNLLCISLASSNAYFLVGTLLILPFLLWRTPLEESRLIERFGEEYRAYMQRTGRYLPKLRF